MNAPKKPADVTQDTEPTNYYIACVELTFVDGEGNTGITRINSVAQTDRAFLGVKELGRVQQAAQMQFANKLKDPKLQILDAVFVSVSFLGRMSPKDFHSND